MGTTIGRCSRLTWTKAWGCLRNPARVKAFLKGDFIYYTNLLRQAPPGLRRKSTGKDLEAVYFNALLDLDAPFLLVPSSCVNE